MTRLNCSPIAVDLRVFGIMTQAAVRLPPPHHHHRHHHHTQLRAASFYCRLHEQVSKLEARGQAKAGGKYEQCVRARSWLSAHSC